ncbi:porin family protein [Simiduia aestuariiviva]|uniref:Outer membrane protein beta-barrel domain-containing protein n=1 Tax=Simiduia aestuariiviva TaxID=1510459 RepID=A0A839UQX6_9GAMM|nr:porin family protein [Simiduia aestuariiviva]MBB3167775.1 hypothetical protein [Simiduia aestuariiviva]
MKKFLISIFAITGLLGSATSMAGDESGFYVGGSIGTSQLSYSGDGSDFDDDDVGYKGFAGYNFGLIPFLNLAVEGSYVDFGTQAGTIANIDVSQTSSAFMGSALAGVNLGPVGVFAKAGVINWDSDITVDGLKASGSGSDPAYGIGAKFQLLSFQLRAEYERLEIDDADIDMFSVGAAYTF